MISGVIPAIPLIFIRPFLPESPAWQEKKTQGTLKRPSIGELFQPAFRRTTLVTTLMFACSYGAAFGAIQHLPRIVPGLPEVRDLSKPLQQEVISSVQAWQEFGGLAGRFALAGLAIVIIGRRKLLRVFQLPGLIIVPLVFLYPAVNDLFALKIGVFVAGLMTVAQFSFWGNYLPRVYPVHLRGTGESFAANIGGRMIGTSAALTDDDALDDGMDARRRASSQVGLLGCGRSFAGLRRRQHCLLLAAGTAARGIARLKTAGAPRRAGLNPTPPAAGDHNVQH